MTAISRGITELTTTLQTSVSHADTETLEFYAAGMRLYFPPGMTATTITVYGKNPAFEDDTDATAGKWIDLGIDITGITASSSQVLDNDAFTATQIRLVGNAAGDEIGYTMKG